jgi:outer membrane protein OmpA-like peptidoglycan-associated protein
MLKTAKYVLIAFIVFSSIIYSQTYRNDILKGRLVLSLEGGLTYGKTDYLQSEIGPLGGANVEYFLQSNDENIFGFRVYGRAMQIKGKDNRRVPAEFSTDMFKIGLGPEYDYSFSDKLFLSLFIGVGENWFNPRTASGQRAPNNAKNLYSKNSLSYDGELGLRIPFSNDLSMMISTGLHFMQTDNLDDVSPANAKVFPAGAQNDYYGTVAVSLSYSLFGVKDSDGDGVPDYLDQCPNTPKGVIIDESGCPIDSDHDGVPDFQDKCPQTPAGVKVDKDGCPLDSDRDGVPDDLDKCPNTPFGVKVDNNGCPLDSDGDGVPDYLDKCPNTPAGVKVDSTGCVLDSDGDGVPDYIDICPNTPKGVQVDSLGCPVTVPQEKAEPETRKEEKKEEPKVTTQPVTPSIPNVNKENKKEQTRFSSNPNEIIIQCDELFVGGTTNINPKSEDYLKDLVTYLSKDIFTKWEIESYVDSHVSENDKLELSYDRANALLKYFVNHGLPSFQFEILAKGDKDPIASNDTPIGRAKNNRIELHKIKK